MRLTSDREFEDSIVLFVVVDVVLFRVWRSVFVLLRLGFCESWIFFLLAEVGFAFFGCFCFFGVAFEFALKDFVRTGDRSLRKKGRSVPF